MARGFVLRFRAGYRAWAIIILFAVCSAASAADGPRQYLDKPNAWFAGEEARGIAANILAHQSSLGGWPKNVNTTAPAAPSQNSQPTFDNGATTDELRYLAHIYDATQNTRYRKAFEKGMDYILQAQYSNGGWPQYFPPGRGYERRITFNDDAMVRLLQFMREIFKSDVYSFVDADRRTAARRAFDRGIDCIPKCQIKVDGKPAVWCAQHDEENREPIASIWRIVEHGRGIA